MHDIMIARQAWIDHLKNPNTKKGRSQLVDNLDDDKRCCLGHACHVLALPFDPAFRSYAGEPNYAPEIVVNALGLWDRFGGTEAYDGNEPDKSPKTIKGYSSLAHLNDQSETTQQEIGEYLQTVIEGGSDTPFRPAEIVDRDRRLVKLRAEHGVLEAKRIVDRDDLIDQIKTATSVETLKLIMLSMCPPLQGSKHLG